jgi:LAO/AO transport system kinase
VTAADSALAEGILAGDRRSLAQAITLAESTRPDHRARATSLLTTVLPATGRSLRLGVSGVPGAGKSTLIEVLGLHGISEGRQVAVLAVDPSSARSGGSILGDKTRMADLGRHPSAFIRPSPSSGTLGGVARRTREAVLLCEAAGFDVVIVETVGVGQSEVAVADLVDLFLLVAAPAGGDELQGIKRGIVELADLIVVNKADGDLADAAQRAGADLRSAVHLLRPKRRGWEVPVLTCSALTGIGVPELWAALVAAHAQLEDDGLGELRSRQAVTWMWSEVTDSLLDRLRGDPAVRERLAELEDDVASGRLPPATAAQDVLDRAWGAAGQQ